MRRPARELGADPLIAECPAECAIVRGRDLWSARPRLKALAGAVAIEDRCAKDHVVCSSCEVDVRQLHRGFAALVVVAIAATVPGVAWGHGDEESERAYDLTRQAIALIVNTPDDMDAIEDKVNDAIEAKDASGAQIPLVEQAKETMEAGDMHQTRALLEKAIGARVHTSAAEPVPIGQPAPATGSETGTVAAIDALAGRDGISDLDWVMLALSALVLLGGVAVSIRLRPRNLPHPGPTAKD